MLQFQEKWGRSEGVDLFGLEFLDILILFNILKVFMIVYNKPEINLL